MLKTKNIGAAFYLIGIAELAIYNFFAGDFAMTRPPFKETFSGVNPMMAYVSGAILLASVAAILLNRFKKYGVMAIVLTVFLLATTRHLANLWKDPVNGFKTLWLIGGALLILGSSADYKKYAKKILFFNVIILFMFFYHCAVAHFQFADFVEKLIPSFIPFKTFFAYFAGVCLLCGGIGLLIPAIRKWAALLSAIQIAGWFLLVHVPRALTTGGDEWIGVGESLAVAGICLMLYHVFSKENTISE
jgi:uncharacterized membrane protein